MGSSGCDCYFGWWLWMVVVSGILNAGYRW